jgi:hypothetical protein
VTGPFAVRVLPLLNSDSRDVFVCLDPVAVLVRYHEERRSSRWATVWIYSTDSGEVVGHEQLEEVSTCTRWGAGTDRCVRPHSHIGECRDAAGNTTTSIAAACLGRASA